MSTDSKNLKPELWVTLHMPRSYLGQSFFVYYMIRRLIMKYNAICAAEAQHSLINYC